MSLQDTPRANRVHIGIFGLRNSGKSSLINALTNQAVAIVSDTAGTTTDPVYKSMEIHGIGPCVLIDTAGFDDVGEIGELRIRQTETVMDRADIAILVFDPTKCKSEDTVQCESEDAARSTAQSVVKHTSEEKAEQTAEYAVNNVSGHKSEYTELDMQSCNYILTPDEIRWLDNLKKKKVTVIGVMNKADLLPPEAAGNICRQMAEEVHVPVIPVSTVTKEGISELRELLIRSLPADYESSSITGSLVQEGDAVLLVMPQDSQAPKGRLILPQVQVIRELLDKKCIVISVTTDKLKDGLATLKNPPKLIITDSQVFKTVYDNKPQESMLTSFSVLMAGYKGDLKYFAESAYAIERLTEKSKVLIAEACTHAPLEEDIGRVKIPAMLRKRLGLGLQVDIVSGTDFPADITGYDLIIHCGSCMFNRKHVLSRVEKARQARVPMTNYGVVLAYLSGILEKISMPRRCVTRVLPGIVFLSLIWILIPVLLLR